MFSVVSVVSERAPCFVFVCGFLPFRRQSDCIEIKSVNAMVIKTDIEKLEPAMTTTYGSINNNPELVAEPGTPMSVASQSPLRVNPLVRPHWQRNLWYYSMIFFTTLIALFIISRVTFLILKANGVNQHLHPADVINTNPADPDPDGQKRCRLCNFKECEMDYCPRLQTNCTNDNRFTPPPTLSIIFFSSSL